MSGLSSLFRKLLLLTVFAAGIAGLSAIALRSELAGQEGVPSNTDADTVLISADYATEWEDGGERLLLLRGHCRVSQHGTMMTSHKMVVWHRQKGEGERVSVYLEDGVRVDTPEQTHSHPFYVTTLNTTIGTSIAVRESAQDAGVTNDPLYERAATRRGIGVRHGLEQTQLVLQEDATNGPTIPGATSHPVQQPMRRVRIFPRSAIPYNVLSFQSTQSTPPEQIWVLTGGINLLVDGIEQLGTVDLSADRMVIWTESRDSEEFSAETMQLQDAPFQVYLEGNIIIRQGDNVLKASRAFYDARDDRGIMLDAELRSFIPALGDSLRIRADRIRQRSQKSFHAQNAWVTASHFGKPGYRLQSSDIYLDHRYTTPAFGPSYDPATGAPLVEETPWITSLNNSFLIGDVPTIYTPKVSVPAEDPGVPLRRLTVGHDGIFGTQIKTAWDLAKIFSLDLPNGLELDLLADYLSERGPGIGLGGNYLGTNMFGLSGLSTGRGLAYYINDGGLDNLGADRRALAPESDNRWRLLMRHRQDLAFNTTFIGEVGALSDRNFLESYYENEFDREKDNESLLYLKQDIDNLSWSAITRTQLNDFADQTEWYPRGDLYVLSEPVFHTPLTWTSHTSAGYARLRAADAPNDPADVFSPLPYMTDAEGAVLMSRHELNMPFSLGPVKVVPYALGEAAFWSEDFTGNQIDRLVGSAGLRGSLMFWKVLPYIHSRIFNLNGLAHKMVIDADYSWTDSSRSLSTIPQYNEFDDNAQERFRERFLTNSFGGTLPAQFDPRFYAIRSGAGRSVTTPYHELIDRQQVLRLGWRHRLQTKVGPPQRQRIKDWMELDLEASYFPNPDRDNFGEDFGLIGGRYAWHIGERTSILADAQYDLFDAGAELWKLALLSQRSRRGSVYLGVTQVQGGPLDSRILSASYTYKMSPKWISTMGTAYDLGENENRGQSLTITRGLCDVRASAFPENVLVHETAHRTRRFVGGGVAVVHLGWRANRWRVPARFLPRTQPQPGDANDGRPSRQRAFLSVGDTGWFLPLVCLRRADAVGRLSQRSHRRQVTHRLCLPRLLGRRVRRDLFTGEDETT